MNPAPRAQALHRRVLASFERAFGGAPEAIARAPGRVNLIGEHTDYNDGYVLPCAIEWHTLVAIRRRPDAQVRVVASDFDDARDEFRLDLPLGPQASTSWASYVRGMCWALARRGIALPGADIAVAGNVPQGAGLSSSAALEVAVGQAFRLLLGEALLSPTALARTAQQAENEFVGCQCGIMDQLISACGVAGHALLIDCRDLGTIPVPLPAGCAVMIVHSGVERGLVGSEYNLRRQQCEAVARHFGVPALRDLSPPQLAAEALRLDALALRRARHVVTENERTLQAADALREGDVPRLAQLMRESHHSMRDDFEITVPAIDRLVALIEHTLGGRGGVRMTGGGFGGCVVALLPEGLVDEARAAVAAQYRTPAGEAARVFVTGASAGAGAA